MKTKTYYRLLCLQGTGYMATGYNSTSEQQLIDEYGSYKSGDWDEEMEEAWARMSNADRLKFIREDMFEIEISNTPFNVAQIH
jgi:hypothetical protein